MSHTILLADDDAAIRMVLNQALSRAGYEVRPTGNLSTMWNWASRGEGDLLITDVMMPDGNAFEIMPKIKKLRPDLPIVVMSAQNTFMTAIRANEVGAYEYLPKPFDITEVLSVVARALAAARKPGKDSKKADEPGETVARALHDFGRRRNGPFVAINMAAIPRDLIEAELFGHEKGAFTGATSRSSGRFEQAEGGTLFLDEIGDMPMDAQTRLLRVLQEGEYTMVGGRTPIKSNVRIVAATHRDLGQMIRQGLFREDLYYRLNVVPIRLPPLRERTDDITDLVNHFLRAAQREGEPVKTISPDAIKLMQAYAWPGNVRELENLVRRLSALYADESISREIVQAELNIADRQSLPVASDPLDVSSAVETHVAQLLREHEPKLPPAGLYQRVLDKVEAPLIAMVLNACGGNQIKASELLGLNRNTLRKKIRAHSIEIVKHSRRGG